LAGTGQNVTTEPDNASQQMPSGLEITSVGRYLPQILLYTIEFICWNCSGTAEINLTKLRGTLDSQGLEVVENQKENLSSRKKLAELTKEWRKGSEEEKKEGWMGLLKGWDCRELDASKFRFSESASKPNSVPRRNRPNHQTWQSRRSPLS